MQLNKEQIVLILKGAFSPYRCEAEVWDYDNKLRIAVFDQNDSKIWEDKKIILMEIKQTGNLETCVNRIRDNLSEKNFQLDEWKFKK